jgi:TATA-binding protein-associated factor Taf7
MLDPILNLRKSEQEVMDTVNSNIQKVLKEDKEAKELWRDEMEKRYISRLYSLESKENLEYPS